MRPFFADLHVHSEDTVGNNDTDYNLSYGRDVTEHELAYERGIGFDAASINGRFARKIP